MQHSLLICLTVISLRSRRSAHLKTACELSIDFFTRWLVSKDIDLTSHRRFEDILISSFIYSKGSQKDVRAAFGRAKQAKGQSFSWDDIFKLSYSI